MTIQPFLEAGRLSRIRIVDTELVAVPTLHGDTIDGPHAAAPLFRQLIAHKDREHFVTLHLDARNRIVSLEMTSVGSLIGSLVHPREVFKAAVLQNAAAILVGHNHPSGDPAPSREDHAVYQRLTRAGRVIGIELLDFLVVGHEGYVAFSSAEGGHWPSAGEPAGRSDDAKSRVAD